MKGLKYGETVLSTYISASDKFLGTVWVRLIPLADYQINVTPVKINKLFLIHLKMIGCSLSDISLVFLHFCILS